MGIQRYSALRLHDVGTEHRRIIFSHLHPRSSFYCNNVLPVLLFTTGHKPCLESAHTRSSTCFRAHYAIMTLGRKAKSGEAVPGPIPSRLHTAYIFSSAILGSAFAHPFPPPPLFAPKALCKVTPKFYQDSPSISQSHPIIVR